MTSNIEPKHITEWDYLGWKEVGSGKGDSQKDWNMTLLTKLNYVSTLIYKETSRYGGHLIMHPDMEPLLKRFPYVYWEEEKKLGNQYHIEFDPNMSMDEIHLKYNYMEYGGVDFTDTGFILIPEFTNEEFIGEITLRKVKISDNEEMVNEYISNCEGVIKIENYGQ